MSTSPPVPQPLRSKDNQASVLFRHDIWKRLHEQNEHFQAGIFGREGLGKSGTALAIAQMVDPDMSVEQVMFDPGRMMDKISEWKEDGTTKGRMIVADEAGVGLGNRTWYDEDQINFAQVLQLIRSENMGILFTVPRGVEMDSQVRGGRLHAQVIVNKKREGDYVELEYERINVGRRVDGDGLWSPKPVSMIDGVQHRVSSLRVGPPGEELWEEYLEQKNSFQSEQYKKAGSGDGDEDGEQSEIKQVADELRDGNLELVIGKDGRSGDPMIDVGLIRAEYELSRPDAKAVKSVLERDYSKEDLAKHE